MKHPAMIYTHPVTGVVARWRWITETGRPAPRIELFPSVEAMLDPYAPAPADLCVYDHETATEEPYTAEHLAARVDAHYEEAE